VALYKRKVLTRIEITDGIKSLFSDLPAATARFPLIQAFFSTLLVLWIFKKVILIGDVYELCKVHQAVPFYSSTLKELLTLAGVVVTQNLTGKAKAELSAAFSSEKKSDLLDTILTYGSLFFFPPCCVLRR
jgi:hypothetical protein